MKLEKKGGVGHQDDWSSHILPGDFSGLFLFIGMIVYPLTLPLTHTHLPLCAPRRANAHPSNCDESDGTSCICTCACRVWSQPGCCGELRRLSPLYIQLLCKYHADPCKPNKGAGISGSDEPMTGKMIYYSSPLTSLILRNRQ